MAILFQYGGDTFRPGEEGPIVRLIEDVEGVVAVIAPEKQGGQARLREVCHRGDLALDRGVLFDGPLTEAGLAALLVRGYGRYDPLFVLNQADDEGLRARGKRVAALLQSEGYESVVLSLKDLGLAQ